jgi:hypothetical protein
VLVLPCFDLSVMPQQSREGVDVMAHGHPDVNVIAYANATRWAQPSVALKRPPILIIYWHA